MANPLSQSWRLVRTETLASQDPWFLIFFEGVIMSIWNWFFDRDALSRYSTHVEAEPIVFHQTNPATGLPMIDEGFGGVDVGGNPYGTDIHQSNSWLDSD